MDNTPQPRYRREFLRSPHHAWLGLLTLGAGFVAAQPLALLAGVTAYALGWIYLPDMGFFKHWVDRRRHAAAEAAAQAELTRFLRPREALLAALSPARRDRYGQLADVCRSIEKASAEHPLVDLDGNDPRLRKLDELMWTYLRLLSIEESLERFLETERREDVPGLVEEAEQEVARLEAELRPAAPKANPSSHATARRRLLESRRERLEVLRKRLARVEQARENLDLVVSEQQRLAQQIKLIRADAFATKNATALTARIDATVEHLDQTNKWLSEMDEFKDLVGGLPQTSGRIGFANPMPQPPVLEPAPPARRDQAPVENS